MVSTESLHDYIYSATCVCVGGGGVCVLGMGVKSPQEQHHTSSCEYMIKYSSRLCQVATYAGKVRPTFIRSHVCNSSS